MGAEGPAYRGCERPRVTNGEDIQALFCRFASRFYSIEQPVPTPLRHGLVPAYIFIGDRFAFIDEILSNRTSGLSLGDGLIERRSQTTCGCTQIHSGRSCSEEIGKNWFDVILQSLWRRKIIWQWGRLQCAGQILGKRKCCQ